MSKTNIAVCGLRYGKTKYQSEQIKEYIEKNNLKDIKITILDSESKRKIEELIKYCKDKIENITDYDTNFEQTDITTARNHGQILGYKDILKELEKGK